MVDGAMKTVVVATGNKHKLEEIQAILSAQLQAQFVSAQSICAYEEPEEDAKTFEENALIKARAAYQHCGVPAIADDSGLELDILGGAPGVYSARYSGVHGDDEANNRKLILELKKKGCFCGQEAEDLAGIELPDDINAKPLARFVSAIAYIDASGREWIARGSCEGYIVEKARGEQGFGYDPHFVPFKQAQELDLASLDLASCNKDQEIEGKAEALTMAQMSPEQKNSISHRKVALQNLLQSLAEGQVS